jgi:DMSO/TMAO reductase YedYZ molybdopterin-dependent catalytic subunit
VRPAGPALTVSGAVSSPASYTLSQLGELPTETRTSEPG